MFFISNAEDIYAFENVSFIREIKTELLSPVDVAVSNEEDILVLDQEKGSISFYDSNGDFKRVFCENGEALGQLKKPQSLAVSPLGNIIIADTGNNRIQVFDVQENSFFAFGVAGLEPGQFREPSGVVVDHLGFIYVADRGNQRVQIFTPHGIFLNTIQFDSKPLDLGVDRERNLYILFPDKGRIIKYSPRGDKLQEIVLTEDKINYLTNASGIAVDKRGDIFITDNAYQSIKKFDKNERILISFGSQGAGRGQFAFSQGLFADNDNKLYVADSQNRRVQIFKVDGSEKSELSQAVKSPLLIDLFTVISAPKGIVDLFSVAGRGLYGLSDKEQHIFIKGQGENSFGTEGAAVGQFKMPKAFYVSLDGQIFIADTGNHRIQILKPDNTFSYGFGQQGKKAGQFSSPQGIAVNSEGEIYVADTANNCVQVFNYEGIYLKTISQIVMVPPNFKNESYELRSPTSLAINSQDQIYVLEQDSKRIYLINENGELIRLITHDGLEYNGFKKPVDIAVDENDYLYVADEGSYRIFIFNPKGELWTAFGSPGVGRGRFQKITSIFVVESKIYVGDYLSDQIQVFSLLDRKVNESERYYLSKTQSPLDPLVGNSIAKYSLAKEEALKEAIQEIVGDNKISKKDRNASIRIESVEVKNDGNVQVTISIPKKLVPVDKKTSK